MKDKLYKHHKKPGYFLKRRLVFVFALIATLSLSIGIPIALKAHTKTATTNYVLYK